MGSQQRRSTHAQMMAMQRTWPSLLGIKLESGIVVWQGDVRPRSQSYIIRVMWWPGRFDRPLVYILAPTIKPRDGGSFDEIPHLIFDADSPEKSALCLFDPDAKEWTEGDLIADTTVLWACEWLHYYELWHVFGEWLAPGVGAESVAVMRAAIKEMELSIDVHGSQGELLDDPAATAGVAQG